MQAASTYGDYQKYIRTLIRFFGKTPLTEITTDQIRAYQRMRLAKAQGSIINKETSVLQQMLKRIGRWPELAADFQPLPMLKESIGRAISDEEESRFFRAGLANSNWCVAAWASLISVNTCCGPGELLHLRLQAHGDHAHAGSRRPRGDRHRHGWPRLAADAETLFPHQARG